MKVLCIEEVRTVGCSAIPIIKVGEIYNVIDTVKVPLERLFYELSEHIGYMYLADLFIPLSDNDETEYADEILEKMFA